jgi:hypothetical protein
MHSEEQCIRPSKIMCDERICDEALLSLRSLRNL